MWKPKGARTQRLVRGASDRGQFVFRPKGAAAPPIARFVTSRGGKGGCGCGATVCKG